MKNVSFNSKIQLKTVTIDQTSEFQKKNPDEYKNDWEDSIIYKQAMKKESIKRGLPFEKYKMYEIDSDEDALNLSSI